ncbi:hypothetical protein D3C81_968920 [compost metagenome]
MCRRLVGNVVLAVRRRLAILAHVGTQQGEITGVARPHEIVDFVAVVADGAWRCVDQTDVGQLQLADAVEVGAVIHVGHRAAHATFGFAVGNDALACVFHGIVVGAAGLAARVLQHVLGDLVEAHRHQYAVIRIGGALIGAALGDEAVVDGVVLLAGVVLDHTIGHVVIGQQQAITRHERTGTATHAHHRTQRRRGDIGQFRRVALEAGLLQRFCQLRQLRGHPHALVGVGGSSQAHAQHQRGGKRFARHWNSSGLQNSRGQ